MQDLQNDRVSFQMKLYMYKNHWRYFQRPKVERFIRQVLQPIQAWVAPATPYLTPILQLLKEKPFNQRRLGPWWVAFLLVTTVAITGAHQDAYAYSPMWKDQSYTSSMESSQSLVTGNYKMPLVDRDNIYIPKMIWPVGNAPISSYFGWREAPCGSCSSNHEGLDMNPGAGAPIKSAMDGTVVSFGWDGSLGYDIVISDNHGWILYYGHMIPDSVPAGIAVGGAVSKGQVIGAVGCTGACTGAHLHFAIFDSYANQFIDPLPELQHYAK